MPNINGSCRAVQRRKSAELSERTALENSRTFTKVRPKVRKEQSSRDGSGISR